jgi:uncharacterized protein YjiS (DUF1127 family)
MKQIKLMKKIQLFYRKYTTRKQLKELDYMQLKDIGVSKQQANDESKNTFGNNICLDLGINRKNSSGKYS